MQAEDIWASLLRSWARLPLSLVTLAAVKGFVLDLQADA
jgi:hypothetical protein